MVNRGLAYWSAAVLVGRVAEGDERYLAMLAHPHFPDACRRLVSQALQRYRKNRIFSRASKDISRYFLSYLAMYLDACGGLTLSTIRDLCVQTDLASPGRAAAILLRLRMIGYVHLDTAQKDRRVRRYIPSDELKTAIREVAREDLGVLALIEPEAASAAERLAEPEFFNAYVRRLGEGLIDMLISHPGRHATSLFSERNSGMTVLFDIVHSAGSGDVYPPRGRLKMSVRDLAKRFEVSPSHVRKLLRDAESEGLLKRDPDERTGTITEKLRVGLVDLHVASLLGNAASAHAALEATARMENPSLAAS
jgi:DNA-binding MarR family transcriptional regulator